MTAKHRAANPATSPRTSRTRLIDGRQVRIVDRCSWASRGFCTAAVDGYCLGGYLAPGDPNPRCHG